MTNSAPEDVATTVRLWRDQPLYRAASDGYFDATRMCAACGGDKRFVDYQKLKKSKEYINVLEKVLQTDGEPVIQVVRTQLGGVGTRGGGGTWIHPRLAIDFARWLSPEFAVWVDGWILETIGGAAKAESGGDMKPTHTGYLHQKHIVNETDLHYAVVKWIRRFWPQAIIAPGLGELQDTEASRLDAWAKGYTGGQPDLLLLNRHQQYAGFALELKHPGHKEMCISEKQKAVLARLQTENWRVLASNDYDQICFELGRYMRDLAPVCECCQLSFADNRALNIHLRQKKGVKRRRDGAATTACDGNSGPPDTTGA
jgi:hypothetical protein